MTSTSSIILSHLNSCVSDYSVPIGDGRLHRWSEKFSTKSSLTFSLEGSLKVHADAFYRSFNEISEESFPSPLEDKNLDITSGVHGLNVTLCLNFSHHDGSISQQQQHTVVPLTFLLFVITVAVVMWLNQTQ